MLCVSYYVWVCLILKGFLLGQLLIDCGDSLLDADRIGIASGRCCCVELDLIHGFEDVCAAPAEEFYMSITERYVCALAVPRSRHVPKAKVWSGASADGVDAAHTVIYAVFVFIQKQ